MRSWLLWRLFTSHLIWSSQKVHLSLLNPCQFLWKYCRIWNSLPQGIAPKWINSSPANELFASIFWEQSPQASCQLVDAKLLQLDADVNLLGLRLEILRFGERERAEGGKGKGVGGDVECRAQWKQEMESAVSRLLIFLANSWNQSGFTDFNELDQVYMSLTEFNPILLVFEFFTRFYTFICFDS